MVDLDFMECDSCRAKPGSPLLCKGCLHNRNVISKLIKLIDQKNVKFDIIKSIIEMD